jgi:ABC-2 type transport system permease protein
VFFDLGLPSDTGRWVTFGWVYLLAVTSCTLLGLAYSSFVPARSAGAMVFPPILVLQFISGVFIPYSRLPHGLQIVASFFPMKWICQGMRSVFLPDSFQSLETGGSWNHGQIAVVLAVYSVVGLAVCSRTFRWRGRADG